MCKIIGARCVRASSATKMEGQKMGETWDKQVIPLMMQLNINKYFSFNFEKWV